MNGRRSTCGFTLIELLVVIIIIAVMAGVVVPAYSRLTARVRFNSAVADVQEIFDYARTEAIQRDTIVTLTYDPQHEAFFVNAMAFQPTQDLPVAALTQAESANGYGTAATGQILPGEAVKTVQLPPEYAIRNFSIQSDGSDSAQGSGQRSIRFHGDGTCDEAELVLASRDGDAADLRLSPATGRLALLDPNGRQPNQ